MDGEESPGAINPSLIVISSLTHVSRIVLPYLIQVLYDEIFVTIVTFM